jgi:hypothetical protein
VHDLSSQNLTPCLGAPGLCEGIMRKRTIILTAVAAFILGGIVSAWSLLPQQIAGDAAGELHPVWHETSWPFPMDQWGKGTAFVCGAADCGTEVTIYLRAKIGFCNCTGGLTDDAALDRVSDFELFGGALYAQAPGQPVKAAWMTGRSRPFAIRTAQLGDATMISVGLHEHCDALVATAVMPRGQLAAVEPAVLDFLKSKIVAQWAEAALGL